ncbi:TMEM175 family protein [Ruegeria arenilitoris]|uniref:TMEM175 family protein n=1 Tax=Ruegeria arenilitoris TaxID=1173585 RepID=UPI00147DE37E|nr:TMEM175 family protein [Ruegeria arenilitoris]
MKTVRLEAFSDGVIAIIITIMVLELEAPDEVSAVALLGLTPKFLSYVMSFVYVGIYWINHHHLLAVTRRVNGKILWANLHLLFWLSLIPFATSWVDENLGSALPVALYGGILSMCALAYMGLQSSIAKHAGNEFVLRGSILKNHRYKVIFVYLFGIVASFAASWVSIICYAVVALIWAMPEQILEEVSDAA